MQFTKSTSFLSYPSFEYSISAEIQKYTIKNDLKNHPTHSEVQHDNNNLLILIS